MYQYVVRCGWVGVQWFWQAFTGSAPFCSAGFASLQDWRNGLRFALFQARQALYYQNFMDLSRFCQP